jgi:hypothetical protein
VRVLFSLLALICFILTGTSLKVFAFEGPLQIRNSYPIFIHADQPYLEKAAMENSMSFSLSHSSTYTVDASDTWIINLDMEITEFTFRYKRILRELVELDVDIPVLVIGGGFMDGFLEEYHDTFGFSDYGRSGRPHNELLYEVREDGDLIVEGKSGVRLGDIRISVKKPLMSSDKYHLSIKGDLEIPISNAEEGFSNGSLDAGIALLFDAAITDRIMTYWNIGAIFPGDVKGHKDLDLENFIYGGVVLEAKISGSFSLLAQLMGQSDIYPQTDISAVDDDAYMLAAGGRFSSKNRSFDLSLTEDINTAGAPDFIINMTYKVRL